jgi:ABC-type amino acid transport substrate-binding protein
MLRPAIVLFALLPVPSPGTTAPASGPLRVVFAPAASGLEKELLVTFAKTQARSIEAVPAPSPGDPLELVRAGRADLAAGVLAEKPTLGGVRQSLVCAARPGDAKLVGQLDHYLQGLRSTPWWAAILTRAFGPEVLEVLSRARLTD